MTTDVTDLHEVPRNMAWSSLEMGLDGHEVISNSIRGGSLHSGREMLGGWTNWLAGLDNNPQS